MEVKASIKLNKKDFPKWNDEQIREYLQILLDRMAHQSDKNGYPLDIGLLEDED
jgi:hypothetical protein